MKSGDVRSYKQARGKSAWEAQPCQENINTRNAYSRLEQENDSTFINEADQQSLPLDSYSRFYNPQAPRPKAAGHAPLHKGKAFANSRPDTADAEEEKASELDGLDTIIANLPPLKIASVYSAATIKRVQERPDGPDPFSLNKEYDSDDEINAELQRLNSRLPGLEEESSGNPNILYTTDERDALGSDCDS